MYLNVFYCFFYCFTFFITCFINFFTVMCFTTGLLLVLLFYFVTTCFTLVLFDYTTVNSRVTVCRLSGGCLRWSTQSRIEEKEERLLSFMIVDRTSDKDGVPDLSKQGHLHLSMSHRLRECFPFWPSLGCLLRFWFVLCHPADRGNVRIYLPIPPAVRKRRTNVIWESIG